MAALAPDLFDHGDRGGYKHLRQRLLAHPAPAHEVFPLVQRKRRTSISAKAVIIALLLAAPNAAFADAPVSTLREIGPALTACWEPPADVPGSEVTVRLSLRRDGHMLGEPRVTYSRLTGSIEDRKRFLASVLAGIAACLPVNITDSLGGSIAGRALTIRFRSGPRQDALWH